MDREETGERVSWLDGASWEAVTLSVGLLALIAWIPVVGGVDATRTAALLLSAGLAAGLLGLASLLLRDAGMPPDDGVIVALLGFLGWPVLLRRSLHLAEIPFPRLISIGLLLEVTILAAGLVFLWTLARFYGPRAGRISPAMAVGVLAWGVSGAMLLLVLFLLGSPRAGTWTVLAVTGLVVGAALFVQRAAASRSRDARFMALGSGPALVIAGTQLLDGVVSYMAVKDPLGVLAGRFQEEVLLSAVILEATGPGYPIAKWALALIFAYYVDADPSEDETSISRLGGYLLVGLLGMVPALFSTTQLVA